MVSATILCKLLFFKLFSQPNLISFENFSKFKLSHLKTKIKPRANKNIDYI